MSYVDADFVFFNGKVMEVGSQTLKAFGGRPKFFGISTKTLKIRFFFFQGIANLVAWKYKVKLLEPKTHPKQIYLKDNYDEKTSCIF